VPGLPGDDRVERPARGIPRLECRHVDVEPATTRRFGHPRVDLDPEHPAAGGAERLGGDARADPDVEDGGAGSGSEDPFHHGPRIARPRPVVPLGVRAERLGHLPCPVRLQGGARRLRGR